MGDRSIMLLTESLPLIHSFHQEPFMEPQPDEKEALRVLKLAIQFMQWRTFEDGRRGIHDAGLPLKRDGMYHYDDGKIDVAYDVKTRPHRIDTFVRVHIVRGFLLRRRELVFDAENNRVNAFRPG